MNRWWGSDMRVKICVAIFTFTAPVSAQIAVRGKTVHTMAGPPINDGVVLMENGKITAVGPAGGLAVPEGYRVLEAEVVTPGLIDAHTVVGLAGYLNQDHDQDQLEASVPIQPELRAIDAYNAREPLVQWLREHGVSVIHTGHGPGALTSGQTMIAKTVGDSVDEALVRPVAMLAMTLDDSALVREGKSPGTKAKMMAMLRARFLKAEAYLKKREKEDEEKRPARDLGLEMLVRARGGEIPVLMTVQRARDILTALRLAEEFELKLVLDGASEAYLVTDEIKAAGVGVILHPTMKRAYGQAENASMETASLLKKAGIPFALQSGFESYVPKTRVVLFEAAIAAANGLSGRDALAAITIDAARLLGIEHRVGSLEVGKDADLVLFDGDPLEYLSHVERVIIDGQVVSETRR